MFFYLNLKSYNLSIFYLIYFILLFNNLYKYKKIVVKILFSILAT